MNLDRVNIIGVPISAVNMETCISNIFEDFDAARGKYICVSNVHTTVMAHDDPEYYKVQADSFMSVPDGKPLSAIGRKKYPEMDQVRGVNLMQRIFTESEKKPLRHFFYGSRQENLDAMREAVHCNYPWLNVVGSEPSVFRDMTEQEEQELADRINAAQPDFVWVALGAPRQEEFCFRMRNRINALMIGIGGALNVLSGIVPDAPKWMRKLGLEWLYRLLQEPKRLFKRYAVTNTKFLWYRLTRKPCRKKKI